MKCENILTEDLLREEYLKNKLSTREIAKKYNISSKTSVSNYIKKYKIETPVPRRSQPVKNITKDWLYQKYIIEQLSLSDIANMIGIKSKASICKKLKEFNIQSRDTKFTPKFNNSCKKRKCGDIDSGYFRQIQRGAIERNLEFNITIEEIWDLFIKQDRKCAISGVEIVFCEDTRRRKTQTASLDRIDSSKGYTITNIQWVHKKVNTIKWDMNQNEFNHWIKTIYEFQNINIK